MKIGDNKFLFDMLRIRRVQEAIADRYAEQEMRCPTHLCIGQEAIPVGVVLALDHNDIVMSHHRAHGHYIAKGGSVNALIAELYGKGTGCSHGWGGSQHLIDLSANFYGSASIIGGTIPIAVGTAFANKYKQQNNVTVSFFGDAVAEEGVLHESMNFAAVYSLPIIFVCENNLYSVQTHISKRQPPRDIYTLGKAHGIESLQVDGNDVHAIFHCVDSCVSAMRRQPKPVFIEALTYRLREHVGPNFDYDLGYRSKEEINMWREKCPIEKLKKKMHLENTLNKRHLKRIEKLIQNEIEVAFQKALQAPFPSMEIGVNVG